ncbi:hypothetical protein T492DRAFT_906649 [Pavlovales sp. CCMP2436]|nr:hypothetical protein T492DRAFT_906649 [Pavlovales sp. CCMP2436]
MRMDFDAGCDQPHPNVKASAEREALCEPPSEEEGGALEDAISEPDLEAELSAAKEEAALAQRNREKYKRALYKQKECFVSLRAELAAAQAAVKAEPVSAKAGEMKAMVTAHACELRIAQALLNAAELRVVAMEAHARAVAAQALADATSARRPDDQHQARMMGEAAGCVARELCVLQLCNIASPSDEGLAGAGFGANVSGVALGCSRSADQASLSAVHVARLAPLSRTAPRRPWATLVASPVSALAHRAHLRVGRGSRAVRYD